MDYVTSYSGIICTAILYKNIYALYVVNAKVMHNLCTSFTFRYLNIQYMWSKQVLDMHTYEARQREYALKGHRHFYFMTLNGSEVWIYPVYLFFLAK